MHDTSGSNESSRASRPAASPPQPPRVPGSSGAAAARLQQGKDTPSSRAHPSEHRSHLTQRSSATHEVEDAGLDHVPEEGAASTCSIPNFGAWLHDDASQEAASVDQEGSTSEDVSALGAGISNVRKRVKDVRDLREAVHDAAQGMRRVAVASDAPSGHHDEAVAAQAVTGTGQPTSKAMERLKVTAGAFKLGSAVGSTFTAGSRYADAVGALREGDLTGGAIAAAQGTTGAISGLNDGLTAAARLKPHVIGGLDKVATATGGRVASSAAAASEVAGGLTTAGRLGMVVNVARVGAKAAGPAAAFLDSGLNLYSGISEGATEKVVLGSIQAGAGALMVAGAFFPPAGLVGGIIYGGTLLYQNREAIQAGAQVVGGWAVDGAQAVGHGAQVAAGAVGQGAEVVAEAMGDGARAAWNKGQDLVGGAVDKAEDVARDLLPFI